MKRPLILTCSLCSNFDPNRSVCSLTGENRTAFSSEHAGTCQSEGNFVRYMHVLPDSYNYYRVDEEIPGKWKYDMSRVPTDQSGLPLFVTTKRGMERAIPANSSVKMTSDVMFGVPRVMTYQGQRELIYELGVMNARMEAFKAGVELTVLPEEEGCEGDQAYIKDYNDREERKKQQNSPWLSEKSNTEW